MPVRQLPVRADIKHLKNQARELLRQVRANERAPVARVREFHPRVKENAALPSPFLLADAQLTIAREYGFVSWPKLSKAVAADIGEQLTLAHHERIDDIEFRRAVELMDSGLIDDLRTHLSAVPDLVNRRVRFDGGNYFGQPSLLEFVAENPVRNAQLPGNIVDVAATVIEFGADRASIQGTLELVASGRVVRECGVQQALIELLCAHGATADDVMLGAIAHGEFDACDALLAAGATTTLVVAAAKGDVTTCRTKLDDADPLARHQALALAAQHGHADIVALLLDAGEDPNRYNPDGCNAHTAPLHQAALAGHDTVVNVLLEGGADHTLVDLHHNATAADWAKHGPRPDLAERLATR